MPYKYIGRTTSFRGKSLWEIVGNLKNFGVGRIVVRSMFERYPEPSYMKILKVEGIENEPNRKACVWVERVFRGKKFPEVTRILKTSYKTDYRLIPKDEEDDYIKGVGREEELSSSNYSAKRILPPEMPLPPLLVELFERLCSTQTIAANITPKEVELNKAVLQGKGKLSQTPNTIPLVVRQGTANRAKVVPGVAVEETVFVEEPCAPRLYQGLK